MWLILAGCTWIDERALAERLAWEDTAAVDTQADTADSGETGGVETGGETGDTDPPAPELHVSADTLDFGVIAVGMTETRALTVENLGGAALGGTIEVTGAGYALLTDAFALEPGEDATIEVTFAPSEAGSAAGTLTLASNDPGSPRVVTLAAEADADLDDDGADLWTDCDDADATAYPGAAEVPYDAVDNDCDGVADPMVAADAAWTILGAAPNDALGSGGVHVVDGLDGGGAELYVCTPGGDTVSRDLGLVGVHDADGAGVGTARDGARLLLTGNSADDWFGSDLAVLGDVDGDGAIELATGAWQNDIHGTDDGTVYLVEPSGLSGSQVGALHTTSTLYGRSTNGWLGYAVAGGDFDGDGLPELASGAPGEDGARGAVYVSGAVDGLGAESFDADSSLFRVVGVSASDHLGYGLAFGDLDADGYADLVACSPDDDDAGLGSGTCWIVAGEATRGTVSVPGVAIDAVDVAVITGPVAGARVGPTSRGLAVGDVDGDAADDLALGLPGADAVWIFANGTLVGSLDEADARWRITGDGALGTAVALADVTGDTLVDAIVGAPAAGPAREGVVHLFAGGAAPGAYTLPADQQGSWTGEAAEDAFGTAVAGGRDLDGDGVLDLAVTATGNDEGGENAGKVYVLRGYGP